MTVIKVPRTPKSAFNTQRPASSLLRAQIEHLEAAAGVNQPKRKAARRRPKKLTEGQAAAYIAELTQKLHPQPPGPTAVVEPAVPPPAVVTAVPAAPRRRRRRKRATPAKRSRRSRR